MASKHSPLPPVAEPPAAQRPGHAQTLRQHLGDALQRRSQAFDGETRQLLDAKLSRLRSADASAHSSRTPTATAAGADSLTLAGLLAHITDSKPLAELLTTEATPGQSNAAATLPELEQFRDLWTAIRSEIQMRQSMEQAPEDAGPLNSIVLVHRSLLRMRELSPGYLQHFLGYLDNLAGLQQLQSAGVLASNTPQRSKVGAKPVRPRKRRE
jgi:hypothetical protein